MTYSVGRYPLTVSLGDLDRDGELDLAVANNRPNGTNGTFSVLLNQRNR
jgi:hypothetical protein